MSAWKSSSASPWFAKKIPAITQTVRGLGFLKWFAGRNLVDEIVDALGDFEILVGDAACFWSREAQDHLADANVDVGGVPCVFDDLSEVVDEIHRFREVVKLHGAGDFFAFKIPLRDFLEEAFEVFFGK